MFKLCTKSEYCKVILTPIRNLIFNNYNQKEGIYITYKPLKIWAD